MVQVVENRTAVRARVVAVEAHPTLADHTIVRMAIDQADPVSGYANLLAESVGQTMTVSVPTNDASKLTVGDVIDARIRKAGPAAVFAEAGSVASVRE